MGIKYIFHSSKANLLSVRMATLSPFAYNVVDECVLVLGLLLFLNLFTNIRRHFVFFASKAPLLHEIHASSMPVLSLLVVSMNSRLSYKGEEHALLRPGPS